MGERGHSTPRHPSGDPHERATDPPATKGNSYSSADLHVLPTPVRVFEKNSSALSFAARMPEPRRSGKNPRPLSPCHVCCRGVGRYCPRSGNRLTSSPRTLPALATPLFAFRKPAIVFSALSCGRPIFGNVGGRVAHAGLRRALPTCRRPCGRAYERAPAPPRRSGITRFSTGSSNRERDCYAATTWDRHHWVS